MCLPSRAGVPCRLGAVGNPSGTATAGEGASPGHQHCPELGMQWSSNFCYALLLLTKPYHSVLGGFFKPYSFSSRHRVGTTGAVAERYPSGLLGGWEEGMLAFNLSSLAEWRRTEVEDFLIRKTSSVWIVSLKHWCVHPHLQLHLCPCSPCAHRCGGPFAPLRMQQWGYSVGQGWIKTRSVGTFLCTTPLLLSSPSPAELSGRQVCLYSPLDHPPLQPLLSRTWKKGFAKLLGIKRWRGSEKQSNTLCILIYICFRACRTGVCSTCFCHASKAKNKGMRLTEFFCVLPRIKFVFPCLTFNSPKTWV